MAQNPTSLACAGPNSATTITSPGPYLLRYAQEAAWREDLRRVSNGEQTDGVIGLAMACPPSVDFCWGGRPHGIKNVPRFGC